MKYIDLFSGCGGLSLGFENSFNELALAVDNNNYALDTFKTNFNVSEKKTALSNIEDITNEDYCKSFNNIDLVMGGPPCQGFSNANRQSPLDDPRNKLYKYFLKFIKFTKPKFLIIENVPGIKKISKNIFMEFNKIDYFLDILEINTQNYLIPQNRKRVFFFGIRKDLNILLLSRIINYIRNNETEIKYVLKDALFGMRVLTPNTKKNYNGAGNAKHGYFVDKVKINNFKSNDYINLINNKKKPEYIYNHISRYNNNRDIEIFRKLPQGCNSLHFSIRDIMPYKSRDSVFKDKYYKLRADMPCKTITAHMRYDCNSYIHPFEARGLTPREAARVQSFPDNFYFKGPLSSTYTQIGNSVPPILSKLFEKAFRENL